MKRIILLLALIVILVAGWSGAWLYAAGQISKQIALMATPAPGSPTVTCGNLSVTGFPFRFDVTCAQADISDGDIRIEVPEIKATALVYRPTHIIAFAEGPLRYTDAFFGTDQRIRWDNAKGSLRMNGWLLERLSLHMENLEYIDALLGETLIASAPVLEMHLLNMPERHDADTRLASFAGFARTEGATMPGYQIADGRVTFEAEISNLPDDIRLWSDPALPRLWQQADGRLTLLRLATDDSETSLLLEGELGLSPIGEVEGNMTLTSNGLAERFGDLIPTELRGLVFGTPQADGGMKQIMTITRGAVIAGFAPLGVIPPLF